MTTDEGILVENIGYVKLDDLTADLLETPQVLRLNELNQLGLIGIGLGYKRLPHVIRVTYATNVNLSYNPDVSEESKKIILATALLHDIKQGPFSHASIDDSSVNYKEATDYAITKTEIADVLNKHGVSPRKVSDIVLEKVPGYEGQLVCDDIGTDRIVYVLDDSQKFNAFDSEWRFMYDVFFDLTRWIKNLDGDLCLSGQDSFSPSRPIRSAWDLLMVRTHLYDKYYEGENGRISNTLIRNSIQLANEEGLLNGRELFEIDDAQMLKKFEEEGEKQLKGLVEKIKECYKPKPPIFPVLNVVLEDNYTSRVITLRNDRKKRLEFEDKVGREHQVFLDIGPLGKEPHGDTKVSYRGEITTLGEVGKKSGKFDIDALKTYHRKSIQDRFMVFADTKADAKVIAQRCLNELGIDEKGIVNEEQLVFPGPVV
jgi:hypothetical protein